MLVSLDTSEDHIVADLIEFIRYTYDWEDLGGPEEPVKILVSQFVAINFTDMKGGIFETLLREGGESVVEVADKLDRKLLACESCSGSLERQIEGLERANPSLEESIVERDLTTSSMKVRD